MLVEDDADLRVVEQMALFAAGYRVITAAEGAAALRQLAAERPALILLDMRMPGMNGWQFVKALRIEHGHDIPIVVVTAAEDARARAEEVGADDHLAKPFEVDDLLRMVEKHVRPR